MVGVRATRLTNRALGYRAVQVKAYVEQVIEREGVSPNYYMIRDELGFCDVAAVSRTVATLEKRGLLRRVGIGRVRRIRLVVNNK